MQKNTVKRLLQDRPISYHPDIARVCGGVKAGVFFSQLLYWSDKGIRSDGYIWKTQQEWEDETALTRYEQEGARKVLKDKGFLEEVLRGVPAKLHYRINFDLFYEELEKHYSTNLVAENPHSSMGKTPKLDCRKPTNRVAENPQTITESTAENTREYKQTSNHNGKSPEIKHPQWEMPEPLNTASFETVWIDWYKHMVEKDSPITQTAGDYELKRLSEMGHDRAIEAINYSIRRGWKSIHERQNNDTKQHSKGWFPT